MKTARNRTLTHWVAQQSVLNLADAIDTRLTCATSALRFVDAMSALELEGQERPEDPAEGQFTDSEARNLVCNLLVEVGVLADRLHCLALANAGGSGKIISAV